MKIQPSLSLAPNCGPQYDLVYASDQAQCSFQKPKIPIVGRVEYSTMTVKVGDKTHTVKVVTSNQEIPELRRICHFIEALNSDARQNLLSQDRLWLRDIRKLVISQPSVPNSVKKEATCEEIQDDSELQLFIIEQRMKTIQDYMEAQAGRFKGYFGGYRTADFKDKYISDSQSFQWYFRDGLNGLEWSVIWRALADKNHPYHALVTQLNNHSDKEKPRSQKERDFRAHLSTCVSYICEKKFTDAQVACIFNDKDFILKQTQELSEASAKLNRLQKERAKLL